jgi:putative addiction module CopG family antidote
MNISLPSELEEFVQGEVAAGLYADASAVVANALREFQILQQQRRAGAAALESQCPPELKTLLLEAINGPHHPMPPDYFTKLRQRIRENKTG